MYSSYLRFKKFISALTIALFAVVNPLLSFVPSAYASEGDAPDAVVAAPVDTPSDQPSDVATPSDAPAPSDTPAPSDSPAPADTPAVSDSSAPVDPTPVPDVTPMPATSSDPVNTDDGLWQILPNGKALTREAVNMSTTYVAPQNPKVMVHFTQLPDTAGNLTIQEIKLSADQQKQLGALSDTAYDISSNMENGTFKYDLTLPNPAGDKNATVKYAEDVAGLDNAQAVTQKQSSDEDNTTVAGLNHFTVFVLVNDTDTDGTPNNGNEIAKGVLTPIIDAFVDQNSPTSNHDTAVDLNVKSKSGQNQRSFIKFDTTPVGSDTPSVTKATLRVYMNNAPSAGRTINLNRVTSTWTEGTVTWNAQPSTSSTIATASVGTTANQWVEFNVTSEVQAILNGTTTNYGWELADSSEDSGTTYQTQFNSGNSGIELRRPQLVVDFATATASPTQYNSPSAASADTGGDGNGYETTTSGAFADAGSVAADMHTPASTQGDRERFYNYNFSIPAGATINGIETRADWNVDDTAGTNSLSVDLSWDGGSTWTSSKADITETDHEHVTSFGSSSDTWGRTWSASDFSNSNFRVRVTDSGTTDSRDFYLDWIPVRVYYTPAASDTTAPVIAAHTDVTAEATSSSGATVTYTSPATSDNVDPAGTATCVAASGTVFPIGTTQVNCDATDVAGNHATQTHFNVIVHDTTAPVIAAHTDVTAEATSSSGATVTYTSPSTSDAVDGSGTATCAAASGSVFPIGTTQVDCDAVDAHGNHATQTHFNVIVQDTTAPVISAHSNITTEATSSSGAVVTYTSPATSDAVDGAGTATCSPVSGTTFAIGTTHVYCDAVDAHGNHATQTSFDVIVQDTTAPVTTDSGTDTNWHNSDVTVTLSCTDSASGCDVTYWSIDSTPTVTTHDGTGSSVLVSTTGIHTINYFSVDHAGNAESVKTAANTVMIDKVLPSVPVVGSVISPTNNPIVSWAWSAATDADSGIQHYAYSLKDAASNVIDSGVTTALTYSHTVVDGIYTFFVRAVDNANNESADAVSDPLTVDLTAPTTPAADNVGGNYYSYPTVALTSNDVLYNGVTSDPVKIYYTEDGSTPDSSSTLYTGSLLINHSLTLKAIAYDNAGNASPVMTEVYVVAPIISNVSSSANINPASERVITWDTDIASSSRVVYGTTSVSSVIVPGGSPDYGYATSSSTTDAVTGVTHHTVTITGLNSYTTYFFRPVSSEALENTSTSEYSFGTEATDGNPGPNGDSSSSGSSNSSSSSTGKVLGATTKESPTPTPAVISGTSVDLESTNPAAGKGSNGSGSGVAGTSTPSTSPSPSVSPSPEASPEMSPQASPTPQSENGKAFQWSWWWLVLLAIIAGGIWYWRRNNNKDTNIPA